jgi:hypothetical protein
VRLKFKVEDKNSFTRRNHFLSTGMTGLRLLTQIQQEKILLGFLEFKNLKINIKPYFFLNLSATDMKKNRRYVRSFRIYFANWSYLEIYVPSRRQGFEKILERWDDADGMVVSPAKDPLLFFALEL